MAEWIVDDRGYGSSEVWDHLFRQLRDAKRDLDWRKQWVRAFTPVLARSQCRNVLDLGCGSGNEVRTLVGHGLHVTGLDFSVEALCAARNKGVAAPLVRADMAQRLPFRDDVFDAVMSNVAIHYFPDTLTRRIFGEAHRVLRPGGLLLLHVNSLAQRAIQQARNAIVRELAPDHVVNTDGGTSRFFSRDYLDDLLSGWSNVRLEHVAISDAGPPFKFVWRVIART